ncbi:isochorismate synthase [Gordonia insulae]|uniref:isochorismate synthase n=1 Tax=Gordonia insulae TaxID=2420509 RepID=A0A3G8JRS1_9ACTN|nr:isochorismate synthase [Gordonia insulae]AZG47844.1 Putative isochorismate synthase MenF [Gordonia insulae]
MAFPDDGVSPVVFVLSRPHGTVRGHGHRRRFTETADAAHAVRTGAVDAITGAIPFDPDDRAALVAPVALTHDSAPLAGARPRRHDVTSRTYHPDRPVHRDRVTRAIKAIADGAVDKVVLARAVDLAIAPAADVEDLLGALAHGNTEHNAFGVNVGAATGDGSWLLGASPEVLLRKDGRVVTAQPYAGSAPRSSDPETDRAAAAALAASGKDLAEHAFVVDYLRDRLGPICADLQAPSTPEVRATGEIWHLATPIRATLRDDSVTALDLALLLSPTPAVCGTPSDVAAQFIREVEEPRGLYGGAVGWCDAAGDGEWMVTIRCLQLAEDRHHLRTWAGGGIVAQSDPQAELDETTAKLRTVLTALGIADS